RDHEQFSRPGRKNGRGPVELEHRAPGVLTEIVAGRVAAACSPIPDLPIKKGLPMKQIIEFVVKAFFTGLLILVPVYLSVLLLLNSMNAWRCLPKPFANLLPEWLPAEHILSLLLVLIACFLIGAAVRTPAGHAIQERIEKSFFERMPGYALFRSLTQRLAGEGGGGEGWEGGLAEEWGGIGPAFIFFGILVGRCTGFCQLVATAFAA